MPIHYYSVFTFTVSILFKINVSTINGRRLESSRGERERWRGISRLHSPAASSSDRYSGRTRFADVLRVPPAVHWWPRARNMCKRGRGCQCAPGCRRCRPCGIRPAPLDVMRAASWSARPEGKWRHRPARRCTPTWPAGRERHARGEVNDVTDWHVTDDVTYDITFVL